MSSTTLLDVPNIVLAHLMTSYLSINDLRSLRLVSWHLRILVDNECFFRVDLNNGTLRWVKTCVPYIQQIIFSQFKNEDFLEWPDNLFPEVEELTSIGGCSSVMVVDSKITDKVFKVFPNVRELCLRNLTGKEMLAILELKFSSQSMTMIRNKLIDPNSLQVLTPCWNLITKLKIVMSKMHETHEEVFTILAKRTYPNLNNIHLEYRLTGYFNGLKYERLHVFYILWLQFISLNAKSLKKLTITHDFGVDLNPEYVPENPEDNIELTIEDSPQFKSLAAMLESMKLENFSITPHLHEEISNKAWNWNLRLMGFQNNLVNLTIDCTECWKWNDPGILQGIVQKSKTTLKSLVYISTAVTNAQRAVPQVIFDLSMLENCSRLEELQVERGWSRRKNEFGYPIIFRNIQSISSLSPSLKRLSLKTDNGKFNMSDAEWISNNLENLEEVDISISMNKPLMTSLLCHKGLKKFTLARDYYSEIKIRDMVRFCDGTLGLTYFCPEIATYDTEGRWLELLYITVLVNRKVFTLDEDLIKKFPGVFGICDTTRGE